MRMTVLGVAGRGLVGQADNRRARAPGAGACSVAVIVLAAVSLAGCAGSSSVRNGKVVAAASNQKTSGKEFFAESTYGVKASPRVVSSSYDTTDKPVMLVPVPKPLGAKGWSGGQAYALTPPAKKLRRGGGREQIGRPYKVRGKWYTPADQPGYTRTGKASWYGDAFHGRLTANGEIYDMNHLTAAHPTLPLPSYARVTNLANGHSVIVRINDRGPYAHGRVIDLSKRAAHVLGTKAQGVGEVRVDYIGRAPVDGEDDRFLLASFRPNGASDKAEDMRMYAAFTGGAMPAAVAVAQPAAIALPAVEAPAAPVAVAAAPQPVQPALQPVAFTAEPTPPADLILPASRPLATDAPDAGAVPVLRPDAAVPLGYAPADRLSGGAAAIEMIAPSQGLSEAMARLSASAGAAGAPVQLHVASVSDSRAAIRLAAELAGHGRVVLVEQGADVAVQIDVPAAEADATLKALWAAGHDGAFALR